MLKANRCVVATQAYRPALPEQHYVWRHYTVPAPSRAIGSAFRSDIQPFTPRPASIGIPISRRNAQAPYGLTRTHNVRSEPQHLCRPIRVRYIAILTFRSPALSWAPGITSGLEGILLLDRGIPRP